ncbi:hypothetical protein [Stenotrophobium rhamnosiphilum]|nr:hypothetical protein [Stenotrophobium rhamnosiphilum]
MVEKIHEKRGTDIIDSHALQEFFGGIAHAVQRLLAAKRAERGDN